MRVDAISRAVRLLYILLLRENTRRRRPARAQNRRAINPPRRGGISRIHAKSYSFSAVFACRRCSKRIIIPVDSSSPFLFPPRFFSLPPTPPTPPLPLSGRRRDLALGSERKASPIFGAGRCLMHMQARIHYAGSALRGGGGGRKEGQGGRVGPGPHASANSRGMWCRPIVVEKRKMGQPANESSRETKESHSHELSPRHLGRVLGCAIGGSTSRPRLFVADVVRLGESFSGPRGIAAWRQRCATHTCTRGPTLRAAEDAAARNLALSDLSRSQQSLSLSLSLSLFLF